MTISSGFGVNIFNSFFFLTDCVRIIPQDAGRRGIGRLKVGVRIFRDVFILSVVKLPVCTTHHREIIYMDHYYETVLLSEPARRPWYRGFFWFFDALGIIFGKQHKAG